MLVSEKMSKDEENADGKYFYTCEECDLTFEDYDQHIRDYHADAEVILKAEEDEEMVEEFLDEAEFVLPFDTTQHYDEYVQEADDPADLEDFFVFAFDPATMKCKRITFSASALSSDTTTHSLVHTQFYNAFNEAPKQPEKDKRVKDKLPSSKRDTKDWDDACTCEQCGTPFRSAGALRLHRKAHDIKPIRCIDDVVPDSVLAKTDANAERYFCEICQRSFDMTYKDLHIASHEEHRVFCKICNRKFDTQENLDNHMRALPDHMPFNYGRKSETDPEILKKRPYACGTCGKRFPRPREKIQHERIHNGSRPYKCEICLKMFRTNYSLRTHLRHHTDLRPYHCHICDKRFKTSGNLKEHIATHFDERNFRCTQCPKTFKTSKSLSTHKLIHGINVFAHKCPKCPRTFTRSANVTKHMLTHDSNSSKIYCSLCAAVFSRKDFLQIHMDRDHVESVVA